MLTLPRLVLQRAKLMLELVPLMIQAGKGREALEEIEL